VIACPIGMYKRSGLLILFLAFFAAAFGITLLTGQNLRYRGLAFRLLGAGITLGSITVLAMTVRRWAGVCLWCMCSHGLQNSASTDLTRRRGCSNV